ncbi:unnamed protein product, partial [Rhizoctonia solani]
MRSRITPETRIDFTPICTSGLSLAPVPLLSCESNLTMTHAQPELAPMERFALQGALKTNRLLDEMWQSFAIRIGGLDLNEHRLDGIDNHFGEVGQRLAGIDGHLDVTGQRLDETDQQLDNVSLALEGMDEWIDDMQTRIAIDNRIAHARTLNSCITQDRAELTSIPLEDGQIPDANQVPATFGQLRMMS